MRFLPALVLLFYTVYAAALPMSNMAAPPLATQVDFVTAEDGMQILQLPPKTKTSIPNIHILDNTGRDLDQCSSTSVSDNGTLLTAGHCVEQCLQKAGAIQRDEGLGVIDRAKLSEVRCPIQINGTTYQARVMATNDCRQGDDMKAGNSKVRCSGLDFAVLQIPASSDMACISMAQKTPLNGTVVGSGGYLANDTNRGDFRSTARDGKAKELSFSIGETIKFQNSCRYVFDKSKMTSNMGSGDQSFSPEFGALYGPRVDNGTIIQTSGAEQLHGYSGGPLINPANGEVVGIASFGKMSNSAFECKGGNFYSSTQGILDYISRNYPDLDQNQIFNCRQNAIGKTWPGRSYNPANRPNDPINPSPAQKAPAAR